MKPRPEPAETLAVTGHLSGRVQGVGFRWSTLHQAERLGLAGWVRNRIDGTVEVFVQGEPAALEVFRAYLGNGPRHATVTTVRLRTAAVDETLEGFSVR
jgi:acylphosphatase